MKIGVLALQGDFDLHRKALARVRREAPPGRSPRSAPSLDPPESIEIRRTEQLDEVDALVIPGGESTTLLKLIGDWGFVPALEKFHAAGKPVFGTCAGLILLAREVGHPAQFSFGFIDLAVERNGYGRQRESFETRGVADLDGERELEMVFIRAPRIRRTGPAVKVLARHRDEPVMARQGTILVAAFHPELTEDAAVHEYFCRMVTEGART
jgi:pyridoxal 5'-phosphate synthase pdxT subunit